MLRFVSLLVVTIGTSIVGVVYYCKARRDAQQRDELDEEAKRAEREKGKFKRIKKAVKDKADKGCALL